MHYCLIILPLFYKRIRVCREAHTFPLATVYRVGSACIVWQARVFKNHSLIAIRLSVLRCAQHML
jgi:hypothetical protein